MNQKLDAFNDFFLSLCYVDENIIPSIKQKQDGGKEFLLIECADEKNASLTELEAECMHARTSCEVGCVDENNQALN